MALTQAVPRSLPGRAGALVAELAARAEVHDIYDEVGAKIYHDIAVRDVHEIRELLTLVRRTSGPVLDLAAGSGRLTIPFLGLRRDVTALDLSASMLELLSSRIRSLPEALQGRCRVVQGDMRSFRLGCRFGAVVLGTTSISLLDHPGRMSLYACVREHLEPNGAFFLSTVDVKDGAATPPEVDFQVVGASGRQYQLFEYVDIVAGHRTVTIVPIDRDGDRVAVCTTTIRMLPVDLLTAELAEAGLAVRATHDLPDPMPRLRGALFEARLAEQGADR